MDIPEPLRLMKNGFDKFNLYKVRVKGDGNCYFHAVLMAYYTPYRTQLLDEKIVDRDDLVKKIRKDLSLKLSQKINPSDPNSPIVYETLGNGNLAEIGQNNPEFSLNSMIEHINSNEYCGEEIQELLSNEIDKNIFYIDLSTQDVYYVSNVDVLYKSRNSVILLYNGKDHYDTCAYLNNNGEYVTHFRFENPLIQFLYNRLKTKKTSA